MWLKILLCVCVSKFALNVRTFCHDPCSWGCRDDLITGERIKSFIPQNFSFKLCKLDKAPVVFMVQNLIVSLPCIEFLGMEGLHPV